MLLLILNAGSSSLRFQLIESRNWKQVFKGHIDAIGLPKGQAKNHTDALQKALTLLQKEDAIQSIRDIRAIGHRVVHGGEKYSQPTLITPAILKNLEKISALAPLQNPANIEGIRACLRLIPHTKNVAVFDTAFHSTLPEKAYLYGLPYSYYSKHKIRKYGFHGTSHEYVSKKAIKWLKANKKPHRRIITCHLGNGVSLTAIKNGKSIDTSMGFTPLEGILMGTRTGSFDPAIVLYLLKTLKLSPEKIHHLLNHESGLLGLTGISSDVRPLSKIYLNPKHPQHKTVKRAFELFSHQIAKKIAEYTVPLQGLDAIVFTGGIGENAWYLRREICKELEYIGLNLSPTQNKRASEGKSGPIHSQASRLPMLVIPTNEELAIAQKITRLL
ncbi:MAG: acetate kinase [Candidatus Gracilibacteria bacterium]